jgi:hypothetical protein
MMNLLDNRLKSAIKEVGFETKMRHLRLAERILSLPLVFLSPRLIFAVHF